MTDNRQSFGVQMNNFYTQLDELCREYPLRYTSDVCSQVPERIKGDVRLGLFPIASVSFSFEQGKWLLERNQQPAQAFDNMETMLAQVKLDYADLLKDLTNWRVFGRDWKNV